MTMCLLAFFAGVCLFLLVWGLAKPGRICEFPFLAGATFAGFVLPQAVGITLSGPPAGHDAALAMSVLCAAMCYIGYVIDSKPVPETHWEFNSDRLLVVSGVLSIVGAVFNFLMNTLPEEYFGPAENSDKNVGATGLVVAYLFFAAVQRYGFAIALLLYLKRQSKLALSIILFDCISLFDYIVIRGRRAFVIEFALCFICAFWFVQRKALPRWVMCLLLAAGTLGVTGAEAYRSTMYKGQKYAVALEHDIPWEQLSSIDFFDEFTSYNQNSSWELRNCAYTLHTTDTFDCGLSYWNLFVYNYVPAQIVGENVKKSLQFNLPGETPNPDSPGGSTSTGMADSFQAFGWFGCLVFFLIAFVLRRIYENARAGNLAAQIVYMIILTNAMHTITHHTKYFQVQLIHLAIFLLPGLMWARNLPSENQGLVVAEITP